MKEHFLDLAEAPKIVLERPAPCSDAGQAEELLRRALAPSVAPRGAWRVTVRVAREGSVLTAEGEITDEADAPVAHRVLTQTAEGRSGAPHPLAECSSLARALGVWASLVLDAEVDRAAVVEANAKTAAGPPATGPTGELWPDPIVPEKPSPEQQLFLKHDEGERTVEIGVTTFIMGGTGAGAVAGPSLFTVVEAGQGWFLRPMVAVGRTFLELSPSSDVYATWGATRFDACKRVPGFYLDRRGIQLDLCAGGELGFLHFDSPSTPASVSQGAAAAAGSSGRTLPFVALGPSIGLRGELGSDLAAMVRAVAEINVVRDNFVDSAGSNVDPSLFVGRAEVGLSWRLR